MIDCNLGPWATINSPFLELLYMYVVIALGKGRRCGVPEAAGVLFLEQLLTMKNTGLTTQAQSLF